MKIQKKPYSKEIVGSLFAKIRSEIGATQHSFSKKLHTTQGTLSKIEAAKMYPPLPVWFRFVQIIQKSKRQKSSFDTSKPDFLRF